MVDAEGELVEDLAGGGQFGTLVPGPRGHRSVADDEEGPAGGDRTRRRLKGDRPARRQRRVQVVGGDEIEAPVGERLVEIMSLPRDAAGDTGRVGAACCALQGDCGDVHAGDLPAPPCEPHGVRAFAAAEVERNARAQFARLVDEDGVGCSAPHLRMPAVVGVPEGRGIVAAVVVVHQTALASPWASATRSWTIMAAAADPDATALATEGMVVVPPAA